MLIGQVRAIRVLCEVGAQGSFSLAARELGMTQSAVSQHVAALERAVGLPLVDRGTRPLELTGAGAVLVRHGRAVTAQLEAKYRFGDAWTLGARYEHRFEHDEPGFEEVARDSVDLVDAELSYRITPSLDVGLFVQNLFDENYFATADALSALAPERSIGISFTWQGR